MVVSYIAYYNARGYNNYMVSVGLLSWWYGDGLKMRVKSAIEKSAELADFFSINILIRTLFNPYKQISASERASNISDALLVFFDKFISRFVGFFARLIIIIVGVFAFTFQQITHLVTIIGWIIIPLMPIIGLILMFSGWNLSWII